MAGKPEPGLLDSKPLKRTRLQKAPSPAIRLRALVSAPPCNCDRITQKFAPHSNLAIQVRLVAIPLYALNRRAAEGVTPFPLRVKPTLFSNTFATGLWRAFRHKEGVNVLPLQNFGL